MKLKLGEKEIESKVTTRSVALFEKETRQTMQDLMGQMGSGVTPKLEILISLIKHATGVDDEKAYQLVDENPGLMTGIAGEYAEWVKQAYGIADAGNSDSSNTTAS